MKNSGYADNTVRDLLLMRSGVDWKEIYKFGSGTQLTRVHDNSLKEMNPLQKVRHSGTSINGGPN
jgi:CubicO group peptidase (beta-lactamase class C family)